VTEPRPAAAAPGRLRSLVELFALCGFAISQPLLDLFGRSVEQFALRGASAPQIVGFGLAVTALPALGLWLVELAVGLASTRGRVVLHRGVLGALVAMFVLQAARPLATGVALAGLAVVAAMGGVLVHARSAPVRLWLRYAAVAPLGFLGLFLLSSPTADLLRDGGATTGVDVGAPAPVVMLVLDELPLASLITADGELDAELFPNLAGLAADSHWFRNTTTVTSSTWHALPAMLTGQVPREGSGPIVASHPDNLFTLLGGSYGMEVTETVTRMCPSSVCEPTAASGTVWRGLAGDALRVMRSRLSPSRAADDPVTGFAELTPPPDEPEPVFSDLDISQPERFTTFIDGLAEPGAVLHYLHILLPHVPYQYLPSGHTYDGPIPDLGRIVEQDQWGEEEWPVQVGRQRHLLQLAYVDNLVGVLLDELRAQDLYDEALVIVTADHGISFQAGGPIRAIEGQSLDEHSAPDILWVPFILKEPGQQAGDVSDANVQTIDVLPTIADVLDVDLPFEVDGQSALGSPRRDDRKPFYGNDVNPFGVGVADPVDLDGAGGWAALLERSVGRFLPGAGDPQRIWRIGPSPELVGQRVDALPQGRLAEIDATLLAPDAFTDVAAGAPPALVRGTVVAAGRDVPLAVVVNGVVAATGPTFPDAGTMAFAVMVDEALFRPGPNDVKVYEVR
jgi:hypothetical protein